MGLGGLPGLVEQRSLSRYGISSVTVVFEDAMSPWLQPVARYVDFFNEIARRIGPGHLRLSVAAAPWTPRDAVTVVDGSRLAPSCTGVDGATAMPPIRPRWKCR